MITLTTYQLVIVSFSAGICFLFFGFVFALLVSTTKRAIKQKSTPYRKVLTERKQRKVFSWKRKYFALRYAVHNEQKLNSIDTIRFRIYTKRYNKTLLLRAVR